MATENFLINPSKSNPPKGLKRRRRKNPIGETLITIGANPSRRNPMTQNPWYGNSAGHRIAALMRWGKIPKGKVSGHRKRRRVTHRGVRRVKRAVHRKRGRWAPLAVRQRRKIAQQAFWTSKYGHMLAHPRSKKVFTRKGFMTMARHKRRKSRKSNTWFGQPRRHRKASKKGWRRGHMLFMGTKRRRRVRHANPMVSANPRRGYARKRHAVRHSRRRRNPAFGGAMVGQFTGSIMNVRHWGPLAFTGGLSAITGAVVPGMLGVYNPWAKYGVQTAVAIGGGMVVERVAGREHGQAWMIVGVAMVGYSLLKEFVLQPYFPQFAVGLGGYNDYYPDSAYANENEVFQQVGAFPNSMDAFPSMSAYPGVGGDNVGAYPYDGAGY